MIRFFVAGLPQAKGSVRAFMRPGMKFPILTSTNAELKPWERTIRVHARAALCPKATGPVDVRLGFRFERGKTVTRPFHTVKPDLDKLVRAVLDALTSVAWADDSQVVELHAEKRYAAAGEDEGVQIHIEDASLAKTDDPEDLRLFS